MKELQEFATFLCEVGNGLGKSLEDGKVNWSDSLNFTAALLTAPNAIMGISQVSLEYFDLNDADRSTLNIHIATTLDLPQDKIESIVENVISVALQLNTVLKAILAAKSGTVTPA